METLKKWGKSLVSWAKGQIKRFFVWAIVNPWKAFRKWLNKSRFVAFIVGAAIAGSYTFCFMTIKYEYKDIFNSRTVVILNTSHALASTLGENADPEQEKVEEFGVSPHEVDTPAIRTIKKVSEENGIDWKLVYAVCLKESGCKIPDCGSVRGNCDNYRSMGYFQINKDAHPEITESQANDLVWSANWAIQHGAKFKDNPALFFKNHNGLYKTTNQWYVDGAMDIYKTL